MPGKGKYTTYNVKKSPRKDRLEALFPGSDDMKHPFAGLDDDQSREEAVARGNNILRAIAFDGAGDNKHTAIDGVVDTGDAALNKVDLTYQGRYSNPEPPNGEVQTNRPGDPMNPYVPDISSPGPGPISSMPNGPVNVRVDGTDKTGNPKLTPKQVKENYTPSENTATPTPRYDSNKLG